MITYKIIVSGNSNSSPDRPKYTQYGGEYKDFIFKRALSNNTLEKGNRVKIRKTPRTGTIEEIFTDPDKINWQNKLPMFIQVKFDDGVVMMCHYSQLKRSKR